MAGTGTTIDPGTLVGSAIDTAASGVKSVATKALPVGAGVFALAVGWRIAKRFVRG